MSEQNKIIGKRIKERRKALKMTQKELGEKIGCAEITVRQYESGRYFPKIDTQIALANALKVKHADLFAVEYKEPSEADVDMEALKRGDVEHAVKKPSTLIATFPDENGDPVNYSEPIEPAIDEERDQFKDLLSKTKLSAEKRVEMLNYFDFIKFKEKHKKE